MGVSAKGLDYLNPLIQGESNPPFKNGIPDIKEFKLVSVQKKLTTWR
jgi:6-phosphofructokinase 1